VKAFPHTPVQENKAKPGRLAHTPLKEAHVRPPAQRLFAVGANAGDLITRMRRHHLDSFISR
jgi:hypothetical protein